MDWHHLLGFDSSLDDNPFPGSIAQLAGKVSIKLPVDDWLYRKLENLNLIIAEGYPPRIMETAFERPVHDQRNR